MGISANEPLINFEKKLFTQTPLKDDDEETTDNEETSDDEGESNDEDGDLAEKSSNECVVGDRELLHGNMFKHPSIETAKL